MPVRFRPDLALWLDLATGLVVRARVMEPGSTDAFVASLREAMEAPAVPGLPRPRRVRVEDPELAAALRRSFGAELEVEVGPTPELAPVFLGLFTHLTGAGEPESYLDDGRIAPRDVERLFAAASLLSLTVPWERTSDDPLRVDIEALGVRGACVSILGALGQVRGLALFPSLEAFGLFTEEDPSGRAAAPFLLLELVPVDSLPPAMRDEISRHGWQVSRDGSCPVLRARDGSGRAASPTAHDYRTMTWLTEAVTGFCLRYPSAFDVDSVEPISVTLTTEGGDGERAVRLTLPPEAFHLFEPEPERAAAPRAGRNDPCPCGSGRKYKKCCLAKQPTGPGAGAQAPPSSEEERDSLELDRDLVAELSSFARERFGARWVAAAERLMEGEGGLEFAIPWSVYGVATDGRPVLDWFLERPGRPLSRAERQWLLAQRRSWLSAWECRAVEPGRSLALRDLVTGETRTVRERTASRTLRAREVILARVVDHGGVSLLCGVHQRALPPRGAERVARRMRARLGRRGVARLERLREPAAAAHFLALWDAEVRALDRAPPPRITNRDGDDLLMTVDRFELQPSARAEIEARLTALAGRPPKTDEGGTREFAFLAVEPAPRGAPEGTVLGFGTLSERALRITTNSVRRADALRREVEAVCAGLLRHRAREHVDPMAAPVREAAAARPAPAPPPPEAQQLALAFKERHYADWAEHPLPALRGRTPREAVRSAAGRRDVDLLLREMEHLEAGLAPGERYDFARIRRELGLED
jgi:hypothetical protein